ncbi:hypothetical protein HAX54_053211, partial [Datura stramonium]|nr:hypothetical protein [Datura stramonium]
EERMSNELEEKQGTGSARPAKCSRVQPVYLEVNYELRPTGKMYVKTREPLVNYNLHTVN